MRAIWQDVRLAGRSLARRVGWTAAGVATLAIGIAGFTLVISLLDQALLRPLRFRDGNQLVTLYVTSGAEYSPMPYADYTQFQTVLDGTLDLAAFCRVFMTVRDGDAPENHQGEMVSGSFFSVLDIQPAVGRFIGPADNVAPGGPRVVVLSDYLWRRQFASDPEIVGSQVRLDDVAYTVIGVAPPGFRGAVWPSFQTAFWIPAMMAEDYFPGRDVLRGRSFPVFQTIGRRLNGTSLDALQARIDPLDDVLSRDRVTNLYYVDTGAPWRVRVLPGQYLRLWPEFRDEVAAFLRMLGFMAATVLGVACANVATLLLARSVEWRHELALRQALGAGRLALVRRLGAEVLLLLLAGGLGATVLVFWLSPLAPQLPLTVTYGLDLVPDLRMLGIGLVVALATGVAFALPAVWRALHDRLNLIAASRTSSPRPSSAMDALAIAQVALAMVLVMGCGLLVRSAWNTQQIDLGFYARHGASTRIQLPGGGDDDGVATAFVDSLLEDLRSEAVVTSASVSLRRPTSMPGRIEARLGNSRIAGPETSVPTEYNKVTAEYFQTFDIPLRAGRGFTRTEALAGAPVAVISETLATRHWSGSDAVGQTLRLDPEIESRRIIGVVGDAVGRDIRLVAGPTVYIPLAPRVPQGAYVNIRVQGEGVGASTLVREHVLALDPSLAIPVPATFAGIRQALTRESRTQAVLAASLAAVALALALVGLYGLMAYLVRRREREMGIRAALGAAPAAIVRLVMERGCRLTLMGIALGAVASVGTNRLLARLLYNVGFFDPFTLTIVPMLILVAAILACWGPARRAARIDPIDALRAE